MKKNSPNMQPTTSWNLEFKEAFKNASELYHFLDLENETADVVAKDYPIFIPRRLAQKIKTLGKDSALAREFLPHVDELHHNGLIDPIGDKDYNRAPQLIHRYSSRALFTPTNICPVHCRYCFRKNELYNQDELFQAEFDKTLSYLKDHPEISEIIFTGGDPFTLSNEKIEKYLDAFKSISSIKDIRFHTRYPVILPSRIEDGLLTVLKKATEIFRTVTVAIHANHAQEFDDEVKFAINKLAKLPIQLLSQTVLLKNVNDDSQTLLELMEIFLELKIRPYYLHHPDQVKGGMHFYISLESGRRIYSTLRKKLPGWALPQYIIDIPGGKGKTPAFNPETFTFSGQLLTKDGTIHQHTEPDFFAH